MANTTKTMKTTRFGATAKGNATRSRSERSAAVKRANRIALLQWWVLAGLIVIGIVVMVIVFSGDGSGVPTNGGPVGPIGHG